MKSLTTLFAAAAMAAALPACMHHTVETTSEVKPIHIVLDVNVKVDKELDNYFKTPQQRQTQAKSDSSAAPVPDAVSFEDALKPVDPANPPPRETMMGRFIARKAEVRKLKDAGLAGEDAKGWLKFVDKTPDAAAEKLVEVENADRAVVYEKIAKVQDSTSEKVALQKALKNAAEAKSGDFLQDVGGEWRKKK